MRLRASGLVLAYSTATSTLEATFPKSLVDPLSTVGQEEVLPPCGHFSQLQLEKRTLSALPCFLGGSGSKNPPEMRETRVQSLGWEDPLEKGMAISSSILAWGIPKRVAWQATVRGGRKKSDTTE